MTTVNDIASTVAEQTGLTKKGAEAALKAAFNIIANTLADGNEVNIAGFGKFSTTERAAREGRNPLTGATIQIAASTNVKFKAAKALKDAL